MSVHFCADVCCVGKHLFYKSFGMNALIAESGIGFAETIGAVQVAGNRITLFVIDIAHYAFARLGCNVQRWAHGFHFLHKGIHAAEHAVRCR